MASQINENSSIYCASPFFMVRIPILSYEKFLILRDQEKIYENILELYQNNPVIQEAISVASPSLYTAIRKGKRDKAQYSSLLKYLLRMSTRSTPFGLFAFVSMGSWDKKTCSELDLRAVQKRARPDMQWLFNLIDDITAQSHLFLELYVRKNPLIFSVGDRAYLNHVRNKEEEKEKKTCSIRTNYLIDTIFSLVETKLQIAELEAKVLEKHSGLNREKLLGLIQSLLAQGFLFYDLFPSLLTESPFIDLLQKVSRIESFDSSMIQDIMADILKYNAMPLGVGELLLNEIQAGMKEIVSATNFVQVDSSLESKNLRLNQKIAKDLEEAVDIIWKLSSEKEYGLKAYHDKFLEKYGNERLIPIQELISEEAGIGVPEQYKNPFQQVLKQDTSKSKWQQWLKNEWVKCIHEHKREIHLTHEIMKQFTEKKTDKAPYSFDLFFEVIADSSDEIDQGNYLLQITNNTLYGGSTFGRFVDILGKKSKQYLEDLFLTEEQLRQDALFVETSYLPFSSRLANVAIHPNLRKHFIDLSCLDASDGSIKLDDIFVGSTGEKLFLYSKRENKELILTVGNVLNPTAAPAILQLMRDISLMENQTINSFVWSQFENVPFLPRITFKKVVFSAAQWRVTVERIEATKNEDAQVIIRKFHSWAAKWSLPDLVFMTVDDNRILLDWKNDVHLEEIITKLRKGEEVVLVEKISEEKGLWIRNQEEERHLSEFVISFVKNKQHIVPPIRPKITFPPAINAKDRWRFPGSDWLFMKFYVSKENELRFLINHLKAFADFFQDKGIINEWFYIHYADPETHLRIRFKGDPEKILTIVVPQLNEWTTSLIEKNQIRSMSICGYEREIERYGGLEAIEMAESFFCADSAVAISLNQHVMNKKLKMPLHVIAALSLINLLHECGLDVSAQQELLAANALDKKQLEGFREHKGIILKGAEAIFTEHFSEDTELKILNDCWRQRSEILERYSEKLLILEKENKIKSTIQNIQNSLLHMHCNRLMKTDLNLEMKARVYALHALENLLAIKNYEKVKVDAN